MFVFFLHCHCVLRSYLSAKQLHKAFLRIKLSGSVSQEPHDKRGIFAIWLILILCKLWQPLNKSNQNNTKQTPVVPSIRRSFKGSLINPQHFLVKCDILYKTNTFYHCESMKNYHSVDISSNPNITWYLVGTCNMVFNLWMDFRILVFT